MISNNLSSSLFWSFYITAPESSTLQGSWMRQKRNCFLRTKSTWKYANIWTDHTLLLLVSRAASDLSLFLQGQNAALTEKHCFYTPQGKYLQLVSLSRSTYYMKRFCNWHQNVLICVNKAIPDSVYHTQFMYRTEKIVLLCYKMFSFRILSRLFLDISKKLKAKKIKQIFEKLKQIIQKLNNLPTKNWLFAQKLIYFAQKFAKTKF